MAGKEAWPHTTAGAVGSPGQLMDGEAFAAQPWHWLGLQRSQEVKLAKRPASRSLGPASVARVDTHSLANMDQQHLASLWLPVAGGWGPNDYY